jgi:hypothetical protein
MADEVVVKKILNIRNQKVMSRLLYNKKPSIRKVLKFLFEIN